MTGESTAPRLCCALSELPITLRVSDLQQILGLSRGSIYRLLHRVGIKYLTVGRSILIPRSELIQFLSGPAA